jgi:tRNA (guanine-N7-)-methyltransferase
MIHRADIPPAEPTPELRLADLARPVSWPDVFGNDKPVHLEIGSGSGHWTAEFARLHPEVNFLAVEKFTKQIRRTKDKIVRRELGNVRILRCDGAYFLAEYAGSASVEGVHVYFPDPWFKKRHAKRRLIRPDVAAHLARVLRPGASLHVKTDITAYQEQILEVLGVVTSLALAENRRLDQEYPRDEEGRLPHPDHIAFQDLPELLRLTTNYERKALEAGHPIHYTRWVRKG